MNNRVVIALYLQVQHQRAVRQTVSTMALFIIIAQNTLVAL